MAKEPRFLFDYGKETQRKARAQSIAKRGRVTFRGRLEKGKTAKSSPVVAKAVLANRMGKLRRKRPTAQKAPPNRFRKRSSGRSRLAMAAIRKAGRLRVGSGKTIRQTIRAARRATEKQQQQSKMAARVAKAKETRLVNKLAAALKARSFSRKRSASLTGSTRKASSGSNDR